MGSSVSDYSMAELAERFNVNVMSLSRIFSVYGDYLPYRPRSDVFFQTDGYREVIRGLLSDRPMMFSEVRARMKLTESQLSLALSVMTDVAQDDASGLLFLVEQYERIRPLLREAADSAPNRPNRFIVVRN